MSEAGKEFLERLQQAERTFDRQAAAAVCADVEAALAKDREALDEKDASRLLGQLRGLRFFELMEQVARALLAAGWEAPVIRRQLVQSLIDQGDLLGAQEVLGRLLASLEDSLETRAAAGVRRQRRKEHVEARGLLGRLHKQAYVDAAARGRQLPEALRRAVAAYHGAYREDPERYWHGINAAACALRAERDEVPLQETVDGRGLAREILTFVETLDAAGEADAWAWATAMEACLALDRQDEAVEWLGRYLAVQASAFNYGSTLRQLEEVWQLDATKPPGSKLLPLLRARTLRQKGAGIEIQAQEIAAGPGPVEQQPEHYEKIFGIAARFEEVDWFRTGLARCQAVAQVKDVVGSGIGTGFLLRGKDLHPKLGEEVLLLTNAHVISPDDEVHQKLPNPPLDPEDARITFQVPPLAGNTWRVKEVVFSYPPWDLDATLVRLDPQLTTDEVCALRLRPPAKTDKERLYIIGHPGGGTLRFSLEDNVLLDYENTSPDEGWRGLIHYRTPTQGGSSGSPVFNATWQVVALHHAGGDQLQKLNGQAGSYAANEGILLKAIRQRLDRLWA